MADSTARGIAVIYQEPTRLPDLSVAETVFIGRQPLPSGRRIHTRAVRRAVTDIFKRLGVVILSVMIPNIAAFSTRGRELMARRRGRARLGAAGAASSAGGGGDG